MTIKAKVIGAIELQLADGVQAVLVQEGEPWNGLVEYRCITPRAMLGQKLIAAPDSPSSGFSRVFDSVFGRLPEMDVLMATSELGKVLKAIQDEAARGA